MNSQISNFSESKVFKSKWFNQMIRFGIPVTIALSAIAVWQIFVSVNDIPHYILPGPVLVLQTLVADWVELSGALVNTLEITFGALAIATIGGFTIAILFAQSKWIEFSFFPFAVMLQVTPLIAIAPLIFIYVDSIAAGLLICTWIVAFFPVLSNSTLGLNSTDHNLENLFQLYGASKWQVLVHLRIPTALPYFLSGLKISGGLSLIGAIVAEFVAGSTGSGAGLAFEILESSYRLNIPRMFASLVLVSVTGILIFLALSLFSHLMLRKWHESELKRNV